MIPAGAAEWTVFWVAVALMLAIDVAVSRSASSATLRHASLWSAIWIGLALAFGGWVGVRFGTEAGVTYLTAYLLEKSLSVDNLFVFALVFAQTGIAPALQRRALFWGVAGTLVMRAALIGGGLYVLERFHWMIYPFAALLAWAAWRMLRGEERPRKLAEATCALCSSWVARFVPIEPVQPGQKFVVRKQGRLHATPLLVALIAIEGADLVFAVDSIPAVFAVTRDPFLVYTSNVFALLGLRSLYFVVADLMQRLRFLRPALAIMLAFVAAKMLLAGVLEIPPLASLAAIASIFAVAVAASALFPAAAPACTHEAEIRDVSPRSAGCEECLRLGDSWVQLRLCLSCGHVGCCDSSKNKHATRHFEATQHPVIRSLQPGQGWRWCYVDRSYLDP